MLSNKQIKNLVARFGKKYGLADLIFVRYSNGDHALYDFVLTDGRIYRQSFDMGFKDFKQIEYLFQQARRGAK